MLLPTATATLNLQLLLPFDTEVNQDFLRSAKQKNVGSSLTLDHVHFFVHVISAFWDFFAQIFLIFLHRGFLQLFDILQQNGCSKNPKWSPFTFFGTMRLFWYFASNWIFDKPKDPLYNFRHCEIFPDSVWKLSQVFLARYNRIFLTPGSFPCDFFPICFFWNPLSIFTRNETFCEHRGLLRVFGSKRLTGDFIKIFRKKIVSSLVFRRFCCLQLGEKWFSSLMRIPWGIFWHCINDEVLTNVYFCICKKLYFFETWAGADLGRSRRFVCVVNKNDGHVLPSCLLF